MFIIQIIILDSFCGQIRRVTVAKDLGYVQHICFNNSDDMISICIGNEVWIIVIEVSDSFVVKRDQLLCQQNTI